MLGRLSAHAAQRDGHGQRLAIGDEKLAGLHQEFLEADTDERKLAIMGSLLSAGAANDREVEFLEELAWAAVRSPRPYPFALGGDGQLLDPTTYTAEFLGWVERSSGDAAREAQIALWEQPVPLLLLRLTEGLNFDEILRAGLSSPNDSIVIASIQALIAHGHTDDFPLVVEAARQLSPSERLIVGMQLASLEGSEAESAARELIEDDEILHSARQSIRRSQERGALEDLERLEAELTAAEKGGQAPRMTKHPSSSITKSGHDLLLGCDAEGEEPIAFGWRRDGEWILDGDRIDGGATSTLRVSAVEPADSGRYECVATNEWGETVSAPSYVRVVESREPPE